MSAVAHATVGGRWWPVPSRTVLVAFASKAGATREIAEAVAAEITAAGHRVTVRAAAEVDDVTPYDAVVLGSAVYLGRWRREAVRFLRRHRGALAGRPVWLFQSGPCGAADAARRQPAPTAVRRLAERVGARQPMTFGGRLDVATATGPLSRGMAKGELGGDWRDWDAIRGWAAGVGAELSPTTIG